MSETIPPAPPLRLEATNGATARTTILLIDDDQSLHELCRHYMTAAGYRLLSAFDSGTGLEYLRTQHVDLVLLDYVLPDGDGYALYREMLTQPDLAAVRDLPVIMLTVMRENLSRRQELLELGLAMYLEKPFGAPELIKVIDNLLAAPVRHAGQDATLPAAKLQDENHKTPAGLPLREARQKWLHQFERQYLVDLLKMYNGNISRVARRAGVHRMTIYRMLKHYEIPIASRRAET